MKEILYKHIAKKQPYSILSTLILLTLGIISFLPSLIIFRFFGFLGLIFSTISILLTFLGISSLVSLFTYRGLKDHSLEITDQELEGKGRKVAKLSAKFTLVTFLFVSLIMIFNQPEHKAKPTKDTSCSGPYRDVIDLNSINSHLALKKKIPIMHDSTICLFDFWSETEDKSMRLSAVISKDGRVDSFKLTVDLNYDNTTSINNLNRVTSAIKNEEINKKIKKIASLDSNNFFELNQKIKGGIISKNNRFLSINFGKFNSYQIDALDYCLSELGATPVIQPYHYNINKLE